MLSCGTANQQELNVAAASSLTESFTELAQQFEREHPNVKVQLNFAGSNQLSTQIAQGASVDVFAAAGMPDIDDLIQKGVLDQADVRIFARNRLALIVPRTNPAKIQSVRDLANPNLRLIVADEHVPVGRYTLQMLQALNTDFGPDYAQHVQANIVSRELNVKQVATKIRLGEGDAGIVYQSDVTPELQAFVQVIALPDATNPIAQYPIAPIKASSSQQLADEFITFVLSADGQAILQKHGFLISD